jgi:hypothetical protein
VSGIGEVPRLALSVEEACAALGVSWDFWQANIASEVKLVRRGRKKLIAVSALQEWLDANAERVLRERPRCLDHPAYDQ